MALTLVTDLALTPADEEEAAGSPARDLAPRLAR
jgi:hypothetical protein